jgi:hypothetical protein
MKKTKLIGPSDGGLSALSVVSVVSVSLAQPLFFAKLRFSTHHPSHGTSIIIGSAYV